MSLWPPATGTLQRPRSNLPPSRQAPAVGAATTLYPRELADVNGDGRADIVGFGQAGVYVSLATGNGHFAAPTFELATFAPGAGGWSSDDLYPRELADVNGDGKADIVGFGQAGVYVSLATGRRALCSAHIRACYLRVQAAGGWSSDDLYHARAGGRERGRQGRHRRVRPGRSLCLSGHRQAGTLPHPHTSLLPSRRPPEVGAATITIQRELADVNGDGRADIVGFGQAGVYVSLATGRRALCRAHVRDRCLRAGHRRLEQRQYLARAGRCHGRSRPTLLASVLVAFTNILALSVPSGLYALDATDTSDVDGDGIGQGAQIVLNQCAAT